LLTEDSKNESGNPPKQAFRIEVRDPVSFEPGEAFEQVSRQIRKDNSENMDPEELAEIAEETYNKLLRYGVFLLDIRGKSVRGSVVPRLYFRRLLLPTFNLTPSQRDNIGMETSEFMHLLTRPEDFEIGKMDRPQDRTLHEYDSVDEEASQQGGT
jgi:hypothetical protein